MLIHNVTSSNIKQAALHRGTLHLVFHNETVYEYPGAGAEHLKALLDAPSVGKFFHSDIKPIFEGRRLNDAQLVEFRGEL